MKLESCYYKNYINVLDFVTHFQSKRLSIKHLKCILISGTNIHIEIQQIEYDTMKLELKYHKTIYHKHSNCTKDLLTNTYNGIGFLCTVTKHVLFLRSSIT